MDCEPGDVENRVVGPVSLRQLDVPHGARWSSRCWLAGWVAAAALVGGFLCFEQLSIDAPMSPDRELTLQPAPRTPLDAPARRVLPGLAAEPLDKSPSESRRKTREERAELRKQRKEAARAKREARASEAQAKREAKRDAARERHAAAVEARRDKADARREARDAAREQHAAAAASRRDTADSQREARAAKREAAREQRAAAAQAKREEREARKEAARQQRELAKAGREAPASGNATSFGARAAASPPPKNAGILRINSRPWAQVFVDGRMVGYTPQRSIALASGEHAVELINPDFGMRKRLSVRVAKGQQVTRSELLED